MFAQFAWLLIVTLVGAERLWRVRRVVAGTTLARGPWWWAVGSGLAIVAVEWLALVMQQRGASGALSQTASATALATLTWLPPLRFAVAVTAFGPLMSILGAQSPQERAWPWIVLSMWFMLALPAAEVLVLQQGQALEIHFARGAFLWILLGLQLLNMISTRFWRGALCATAAQMLLLSRDLPGVERLMKSSQLVAQAPWVPLVALSCAVLAVADVARGLPDRSPLSPLDRLWLDFRDLFGTLWSARVAERLNSFAQQRELPMVLHWTGWSEHAVQPSDQPQLPHSKQTTLPSRDATSKDSSALPAVNWNLLRRFVSRDWFASRCRMPTESDRESE